jgi:hypothetical protein
MILEAISGYLSDRGVDSVYVGTMSGGYVAVGGCQRSEVVLITCYEDVVAVDRPMSELLVFCVSDPGMLGKVLGVVRPGRGCDDS